MKIYFAPLEGITGYIFRNAYNEIYGNVDKFFSPFVAPSESSPLTPKERRDLSPENNRGINLVPQILTCRPDHFIEAAKEMQSMGCREVNLNLGCPSGTVCAKGKGAGFLEDTSALQSFLFDIYSFSGSEGMKISIKTRLGYEQPDEFFSLLDIFNEFPVSELIVHPRIRSDFYKGEPRREYFTYALSHAKCPVVYNGNIFTGKDYEDLADALGSLPDPVMLGRGLVSDPSLADKLRGDTSETDMLKFRKLHDTLYHEYQKVMAPDINVLHKMRELWSYWKVLFEGRQENERDFKRLLKAKKYAEYEAVAYRILEG